MHVRSVTLQGFMTHVHTKLELPESGVVVITGENGSGKSALVEGVAFGIFGETLRGNDPWTDKKAFVRVVTDEVTVQRERKGRSVEVSCTFPDGTTREKMNVTQAKAVLSKSVMSWDVWRRACAFSTSDVAHFSLAGDKAQKELIENVLGMGIFDPALKSCRVDLNSAKLRLDDNTRGLERVRTELEHLAERRKENSSWAGETVTDKELAGAKESLSELRAEQDSINDDLEELAAEERKGDRKIAELRAKHAEIQRRVRALSDATCPTCGQEIPAALREKLEAEAERTVPPDTSATDTEHADRRAELRAELRETASMLSDASARLRELERARERAEAVRATLDQISRGEKAAKEKEASLVAERPKLASEVAALTAVESVLGLTGVRVPVLGKALDGLDEVAGVWMSRIAPSFRLRLRPYLKTKTAGTSDKFSLTLEGAGGGSYKGASAGQRRRVDVALLFALSEMAAGARGQEPGTLFVDEVFDVLDDEGRDSVAATIREIASDRCVVVITHNKELVQAMQPVQHMHLE